MATPKITTIRMIQMIRDMLYCLSKSGLTYYPMFGLGGGLFTFAALFYVAAGYEHLSGWKWALAST